MGANLTKRYSLSLVVGRVGDRCSVVNIYKLVLKRLLG